MLPRWFLAQISRRTSLTKAAIAGSLPPDTPSEIAFFLFRSSWDHVLAVLMCKVLWNDVGAFGACVGSGKASLGIESATDSVYLAEVVRTTRTDRKGINGL